MTEADKKDPDMEGLKQAFALFDRDRDGEINKEELAKVSNNEKHQGKRNESNKYCFYPLLFSANLRQTFSCDK